MSNLSDLLPAGASAKSIEAVASGTLAAGDTVGLNTDGTVSAIGSPAAIPEAIPAAAAQVYNSSSTSASSIAFDPNTAGEFVIAFLEAGVLKAIVGNLSGTTVTFGTAVTVGNGNDTLSFSGAQYNPNVAKQFVIAFTDANDSYKGKVALGTVASTVITMQADVIYDANNLGSSSNASVAFDPNTSGKFVIMYKRAGAAGNGLVCTISGTTITANSPTTFGTNAEHLDCAFDQNTANKVVAVYQGSPGDYGQAVVGTVSGTGISFGSVVTFESAATQFPSVDYNPGTANKVVIAYKGDGQDGKAALGTVSGTSISFATAVTFGTDNEQNPNIVFDPNTANKFVISYNHSGGDPYVSKLYIVTGTASSSTVSLGTPIEVFPTAPPNNTTRFNPDSDSAGQFMTTFEDDDSSTDVGTLILGQIAATQPKSSADFVGIADEAISDTATGVIVVQGGTKTSANTTLPQTTSYGSAAVFESATTDYTSSTFDSNSNKVVVSYEDGGNSNYGTAVVGTVSGTAISYGTPVVFESATTKWTAATFDSDSNKVVISYEDGGNSNYGTAIVGTVSGTSISFGTAVVFESADVSSVSATFDSDSNQVVIAYTDQGNGDRGTAVVGAVSGTSISFGTPVVFGAGSDNNISITFDSDSNKAVIAYRAYYNSSYGTAIVGTVSGTAISYGSEVTFESASTYYISATFDSNSNKVVIAYQDDDNSDYGTGVVGTVSGTAISFGTPVVFEAADTESPAAVFDSNSNKVVIAYMDVGNSNYGTGVIGTVSGTAISFGTPVVFGNAMNPGTYQPGLISATFDSNSNKVVIAYQDADNSDYGTGIVGTIADGIFTIGSNYYVQPDGSYDTSAGSPSVKAGLAISTTSLLLSGDS